MTSDKDGLGYTLYAECLTDMLYDHKTDTPLTVGIYGNWGQGKTSLLDLVEERILEKENENKGNIIMRARSHRDC